MRLAGAPAGVLAVALLALSPRYVGHAANNPKDMPFAALSILALLAFTLVRSAPPFLSWPRAPLVGLALALPLNVRPGGLLYLGYFGGLLAAMTIRARAWAPRQLAATASRLMLVAVVTLTAGTLFWPWAQQNPFVRPVIALFQVSHFEWNGDVLFAGKQVKATALPWTYAPVWIAITTPLVVLCGLLWSAGATCLARKDERLWRAGLWAVGLCPLVLAAARHSTLYDGWRHLLFVYPPLVVLAASGWRDLVVASSVSRLLGGAAVAALVAGCAEPLVFMLKNHPNEVVYFNGLVGGPHGAFRYYELDYWGNSLLEATRWTAEVAECAGRPVAVSGFPYEIVAEDAARFTSVYTTPPGRAAHHLEVQLLRDTREGLRRTMERGDILHVVRMDDGTPLAVVLPGPSFREIEATIMAGGREPHRSGATQLCAGIRTEVGRATASVNSPVDAVQGARRAFTRSTVPYRPSHEPTGLQAARHNPGSGPTGSVAGAFRRPSANRARASGAIRGRTRP